MLRDVDGRKAWCRRLRDLVADHVSDMGGLDHLSTAELVLVKRAAMLTVQLEMQECQFAEQDGMATTQQMDSYGRALNTCRRTLEALGLKRRAKDVSGPTLGEILREGIRRDREAEDAEEVNA